jgi:hypothetical protein
MKKKKKPNIDKSIFTQKVRSDFITVKTSLKSILKDYDINFPTINNLVIECNDIVIKTYQFIRLYILNKYYNKENILHLDKDTVLYFIRACGIRNKCGKKSTNKEFEKELNTFYIKEFEPCINKEKFNLKNKSYITPYLAQQIQTGFNNNLKEHFITRIRHFMNIMKPNEELDKKVFNKIKNLILLDKLDKIPKEYKQWSENIRNNYLPKEYEKIFGYDVKINPDKYLFYTIKMNEEIEKRNNIIKNDDTLTDEEKRIKNVKLFQPIPLRNTIIPNYITIDTNVILSLFKCDGESQLNKKTKKNKNYIWNKIFNTDKRVMKMKGYEFNTIQTDGIGVSICFQKIGRKFNKPDIDKDEIYINDLSDEDLKLCKNKKIVSIDPNKQSLVYMMDDEKNKLRYTASQRRIESLSKRNNRITHTEKVKNKIIEEETKLSECNCKTVNYEDFKKYITEKTKLNDKLREFYEQELFRKLKWRSWIYRRKSEDKFLNKIEETFGNKEDLLLCYGDWSNPKQMKHIMPTKGIGMRRIIEKKFDVVLIDEYCTSKLCSHCHNELTNYKNIHRLLVCSHCKSNGLESKNITFMNRDMNACMNILNLSKQWINTKTRPDEYSRNTDYDFHNEEKHNQSVVFTVDNATNLLRSKT